MSRTVLAEAYQAIPDNDAAVVELEAAQSIFERLGALDGARRAAEATTGTFLFTDICGSTNLLEAIGDAAWHDFVEWHDRTLRALFGEHGGEEVDHAGDGFSSRSGRRALRSPAPSRSNRCLCGSAASMGSRPRCVSASTWPRASAPSRRRTRSSPAARPLWPDGSASAISGRWS